jgi:hypothetical protein
MTLYNNPVPLILLLYHQKVKASYLSDFTVSSITSYPLHKKYSLTRSNLFIRDTSIKNYTFLLDLARHCISRVKMQPTIHFQS